MNTYTVLAVFAILACASAIDLASQQGKYKSCMEALEVDYEQNKGHLQAPTPNCIVYKQSISLNASGGKNTNHNYPYVLKFNPGEKDSILQGIQKCLDQTIAAAGGKPSDVYSVEKAGVC